MGAGVVKPQPGGGFRIHISQNNRSNSTTTSSTQQTSTSFTTGPNNSRPSSNSIMNCEECDVVFSVFKKKKSCNDCGRNFCSSCTIQLSQGGTSKSRQCKKCQCLLAGNFTRAQLLNWKIKDLKALLSKHNVNTTKCKEKNDLIDLLFRHYGNSTHDPLRRGTEHERLVEQLAERMRQEHSSNSQPTPRDSRASPTPGESPRPTPRPSQQQNNPLSDELTQRQQREMRETEERLRHELEEEERDTRPPNPHLKLADIQSEDEIDGISIRDLKRLLLNNFVDFKGCCERWELQERVKRLWRDNEANKKKAEDQRKVSDNPSTSSQGVSSNDGDLCKICMDATIDCVLLECGHMVTCTNCGKQLSECPMCRQFVVRAVHTFRS